MVHSASHAQLTKIMAKMRLLTSRIPTNFLGNLPFLGKLTGDGILFLNSIWVSLIIFLIYILPKSNHEFIIANDLEITI